MSLLIKSVGGEPVIEGDAELVEHFSTALLDAAYHTDWLRVVDDRIVITDGTRTVVYRITEWAGLPVDGLEHLPVSDDTFVRAELVSDSDREVPL